MFFSTAGTPVVYIGACVTFRDFCGSFSMINHPRFACVGS